MNRIRVASMVVRFVRALALGACAGLFSTLVHAASPVWPGAEWSVRGPADGVDAVALENAADAVMQAPETRHTQALVVVHQGVIVAERYAPGHDTESRFLSASIAKNMLAGPLGILVGDGRLALDAPAPVRAWHARTGDPRSAITIRHLMAMQSGLAWEENPVSSISDTIEMLVGEGRLDMARFAADRKLAHPPGAQQAYSSGDAMILSGIVRDLVGGTRASYDRFLRTRLFEPLGMRGTVVNYDAAGAWQASTYVWAPARDVARWGYLLLREGRWNERQLLPSGFVAAMREPAAVREGPGAPASELYWTGYGLLTATTPDTSLDSFAGTFGHDGLDGQMLLIDPRRDLVIVRLGRLQENETMWAAMQEQMTTILAAFPAKATP